MQTKYVILFATYWTSVLAETSSGRPGHGLIGYGINMYQPYCATACRDSISSATLNCTKVEHGSAGHGDMQGMDDMDDDMGGMHMGESPTSPECYATDDVFLQTLAYCIASHCGELESWKAEQWWSTYVAGRQSVQPKPKQSYGTTMAQLSSAPTKVYKKGKLNETSIVDQDVWLSNFNAEYNFESGEIVQEKYGLVILLSGIIIPIAFSLLRFVPFPSKLRTRFYSIFVEPPLIGRKHATPTFFGLELMPTRGQAFLIFYFTVINVVFSAVSIRNIQPNAWFPDMAWASVMTTVADRQGLLCFANLPLVFLYAGRNNVLLWVTNWSHSTFLLLHRYIAAIASLQAILHSILWLRLKVHDGTHSTESKLPYWVWGIVATLACSIAISTAFIPIRRRMYEVFLIGHIVLAILFVAGCYLHIVDRFQHQWGYENWLYIVIAVWVFDRTMRVLRIARNGVRKAIITVVDDDYIRVDIPGLAGDGHAYLYFPTLTWRVWENHPFSVASSVVPVTSQQQHVNATSDLEKSSANAVVRRKSDSLDGSSVTSRHNVTVGLTFLVRTHSGITRLLRNRSSVTVLVESPYCKPPSLSEYSNLIAICGGVGITALLPIVRAHPGRTKLYWGARTQTLIEEMMPALHGVEKETFVGKRMNVGQVLEHELKGETAHTVVVVSGPPSLADDVRNEVNRLGRSESISVKLVEESFNW